MNRLVRAEWLKLRTTRSTSALPHRCVGGGGTPCGSHDGDRGTDRQCAAGIRRIPREPARLSTLPRFVGLLLGLLATAGEYQHRTITQTFLVTPVRGGSSRRSSLPLEWRALSSPWP